MLVNDGIFQKMKLVYDSLKDEKSKMIFKQRLLYSLTKDVSYVAEIVKNTMGLKSGDNEDIKHIDELFKDNDRGVIIFGAGYHGKKLYNLFHILGYKIECFCDSNPYKQKELYCGLPVIPPETLNSSYACCNIIIASFRCYEEIYEELRNMEFPINQIFTLIKPTEYFDNEILKPKDHEVFIDAGCYDCSTTFDFIDWCKGNYDKIYAFEPDIYSLSRCMDISHRMNIPRFELTGYGLWSRKDILKFTCRETGASSIDGTGIHSINVISLDEFLKEEKPTFIKMDIEGSELEALKGTRFIIQNYRPKLAICVYHKPEDIIEIASYILELVPNYELYLRHYSVFTNGTILYAI